MYLVGAREQLGGLLCLPRLLLGLLLLNSTVISVACNLSHDEALLQTRRAERSYEVGPGQNDLTVGDQHLRSFAIDPPDDRATKTSRISDRICVLVSDLPGSVALYTFGTLDWELAAIRLVT